MNIDGSASQALGQLADRIDHTFQGRGIGDAHAVREHGVVAFGPQLFVHLRSKTMHQDHTHAHALDQRQVLRDQAHAACRDGLAGDAHHHRLAAQQVDVRRNRAKPRDKSEVENN